MNESFELEFTPFKNDYKKVMNIIMFDTFLSRKEIFITLAGFLLGILLWIFFSNSFLVIYFTAFCFLTLLFITLYYYIIPVLIDRNRFKSLERVTLIVNDDGIESRMQYMQSKVNWKYFKYVWETNDFLILLGPGNHYSLIPKRVFNDELRINIFKDFLTKHIGPIVRKK